MTPLLFAVLLFVYLPVNLYVGHALARGHAWVWRCVSWSLPCAPVELSSLDTSVAGPARGERDSVRWWTVHETGLCLTTTRSRQGHFPMVACAVLSPKGMGYTATFRVGIPLLPAILIGAMVMVAAIAASDLMTGLFTGGALALYSVVDAVWSAKENYEESVEILREAWLESSQAISAGGLHETFDSSVDLAAWAENSLSEDG